MTHLRNADGSWLHVWRDGRAEIGAFLDDYAYLASALLQLWEGDGDARWLAESLSVVDQMLDHFSDTDGGGFYFTSEQAEPLITRVKDSHDGSVPSGNSMAAWALLRLGQWTFREDYSRLAQATIESSLDLLQRSSMAAGQWLIAVDEAMGGDETWVVLVGEATNRASAVRTALQSIYAPTAKRLVVAVDRDGLPSQPIPPSVQGWLENRSLDPAQDAVLYRCRGSACQPPVFGIETIIARLSDPNRQAG